MDRASIESGTGLVDARRLILSDVVSRSAKVGRRVFQNLVMSDGLSLACEAEHVSNVQGVLKRCNWENSSAEAVFFRALRSLCKVTAGVSMYIQAFQPEKHGRHFDGGRNDETLRTAAGAIVKALQESCDDIRPPLPFYCSIGLGFSSRLVSLLRKFFNQEECSVATFDRALSDLVQNFQKANGLFESGILDLETAEQVSLRMSISDYVLGVAFCLGETMFKNLAYGGNVNCVSFVHAVLCQLVPHLENDERFRNLIYITDPTICSDIPAAVARRDQLLAGVSFALVEYDLGEFIPPDDMCSGDFVQYWYVNDKGGFGGHCGIIEDVSKGDEDTVFSLYGAHSSRGGVASLNSISSSTKVLIFVSRLKNDIVQSARLVQVEAPAANIRQIDATKVETTSTLSESSSYPPGAYSYE